jgi:uncharacterized protein YjeT (DUF2065 family)
MTANQAQATPATAMTTPTAANTAQNAMSSATQRDLSTELGKLRASNNSGPMDSKLSVLGVLLAIAGLVIILVNFLQSRNFSDMRDQMDALILSLFGIGLVIVGATLYIRSSMTRFLRYWLLRMVYEQRDLARPASNTPSLDD